MAAKKTMHYESLLDRIEQKHAAEEYYEACWMAYAALEDRLRSALIQTGGSTVGKRGIEIRGLGRKLNELEKRRKGDVVLQAHFETSLLQRIKRWKDGRDGLIHALADGTKTLGQCDKEAFLLSTDSGALVSETAAACRRLKKRKAKILRLSP